MLSSAEKEAYLESLSASLALLFEQNLCAALFDSDGVGVICSHNYARSIGLTAAADFCGLSYRENYQAKLATFFKEQDSQMLQFLHKKWTTLAKIQDFVIAHKQIAQFIDLLPYDGSFRALKVTYQPILHPTGGVVALQSFAFDCVAFSFQEQLLQSKIEKIDNLAASSKPRLIIFSQRENEILFLLAHGSSQQQISQILQISLDTVAKIISAQLCPKFALAPDDSHLLASLAIEYEFHNKLPPSLWKPAIIIEDEQLLAYIQD